jgi:hypothetical protein
MVQLHALPWLMEQEDKNVGLALRNGLSAVHAAPLTALAITAVSALIAFLSVRLAFPFLLGLPCLIATLGTRAVQEEWPAPGG